MGDGVNYHGTGVGIPADPAARPWRAPEARAESPQKHGTAWRHLSARLGALSLRTRVVSIVILLFLGGLWALVYRVNVSMEGGLEKVIAAQLSNAAVYVAEDVNARISSRFERLDELAATITADFQGNAKRSQWLLEERDLTHSYFSLGVVVADRDGTVIAEYPHLPGRLGSSKADDPVFRAIQAGVNHAVGKPDLGRFAHQVIVSLAVPWHDGSGAVAGMVAAPIATADAKVFGALANVKLGAGGHFLVVSPAERVIVAATDASRVLTPVEHKGANPLLDRRLKEGYEAAARYVNPAGEEFISAGKRVPSTGWMVLARLRSSEAFAPIAALKRDIYLVAVLLSLLFALVLGEYLSGHLARLNGMAEAMRDMTEGRSDLAPLAITHEDEIGALKRSFNRLLAERTRLEQALREEIASGKRSEKALQEASSRLQAFAARAIRAQEDERRSLAFELHEELAQELTTLNLHLQLLQARHEEHADDESLQQALEIAGTELQRVRGLAAKLHPAELEDFGLLAGLRAHCARQTALHDWRIHFSASEPLERPPREVEHAFFRAAQEALINIADHARASEIWVDLRSGTEGLALSIRDNGIGFEPVTAVASAAAPGLGLAGIRERLRVVGGGMQLASSPGKGTELRLLYPQAGAQ